MGFPFFGPPYVPGTRSASTAGHEPLRSTPTACSSATRASPSTSRSSPRRIEFVKLVPDQPVEISGFTVTPHLQLARRRLLRLPFERDGKAIVYSTDRSTSWTIPRRRRASRSSSAGRMSSSSMRCTRWPTRSASRPTGGTRATWWAWSCARTRRAPSRCSSTMNRPTTTPRCRGCSRGATLEELTRAESRSRSRRLRRAGDRALKPSGAFRRRAFILVAGLCLLLAASPGPVERLRATSSTLATASCRATASRPRGGRWWIRKR